ncbi:MAG TPA: hypothetical protein VMT19_11485 [Thermoanaerobaculaceae bacterium]|nr:hypothetical protein [Thermoanaerobaculaceae bacterium]
MLFRCETDHLMGLDAHDTEDPRKVWAGYDGEPKCTRFGLESLRLARPLRPGSGFTVPEVKELRGGVR